MKYDGTDRSVTQHESFPSRGTWIEIQEVIFMGERKRSFPSRGTWIEIIPCGADLVGAQVVPLAGNVD